MKKSKFQFINPYLEESSFVINPNYSVEDVPKLTMYNMKNAFSVQAKKSETQNNAIVKLTLDVNKELNDAPFKLSITVASDFTWDKNMSDETIDKMLTINAPALLLGYMRPIVATLTNSSIFPAYNIPFVNFNE